MTTRDLSTRYGANGQILCTATNRAGYPCATYAMRGQKVCRVHGGASGQARRAAKLRLAALADPAIAVLAEVMASAEKDSDRLRAADSVLDRTGWSRQQRIDIEDARATLIERIIALRSGEDDD